ncbi:molybdate transport system substrate-binding protein [Izhakiella capsodis]|uniref:Molybdate transport system substrate-binding protein n=1 Tax=Izhakiella capsodis TaxID=1367852 RepID=A0A1I4V674_9GAMM|nr:molybdate transport system substrate-binding protein [Izhakiella capsodis]
MHILAAGSLKLVWPRLMVQWPQAKAQQNTEFGPAGLLCEAIMAGRCCDLFVSANQAHPQRLLAAGIAREIRPFTTNSLCLTVRADACHAQDNWLTLLRRPDLRLATSTAGCDPCGDYSLTLFERIAKDDSPLGSQLRQRAMPLVGGRDCLKIPAGQLAASWLLTSDFADMFIGYASYRSQLERDPSLRVFTIPAEYNPRAIYTLAVMNPIASELAYYLCSPEATELLTAFGFNAVG